MSGKSTDKYLSNLEKEKENATMQTPDTQKGYTETVQNPITKTEETSTLEGEVPTVESLKAEITDVKKEVNKLLKASTGNWKSEWADIYITVEDRE